MKESRRSRTTGIAHRFQPSLTNDEKWYVNVQRYRVEKFWLAVITIVVDSAQVCATYGERDAPRTHRAGVRHCRCLESSSSREMVFYARSLSVYRVASRFDCDTLTSVQRHRRAENCLENWFEKLESKRSPAIMSDNEFCTRSRVL